MTRNLNEIERFFNPEPTTTIQPKQVGFKRLTEDAVLPTKAFPTDSGWDLTAVEDTIVEPGDTVVVKTGIAVELPPGYEAQIRPRSGITSRTKLRVQLGTIDNQYTGELGVIVDNIAPLTYEIEDYGDGPEVSVVYHNALCTIDKTVTVYEGSLLTEDSVPVDTHIIRKGNKIAQLVITRLPEVTAVEITELGDTTRGDKGFGSSGVSTEQAMKVAEAYSKVVAQNGHALAKLAKEDN